MTMMPRDMSTKNSHLVDVVIPAFNAEKYIAQTLDSVKLQGNVIAKIIVVNDGSTDNTQEVITQFANNSPEFAIEIITQTNQGLSAARNSGIRASTAPFIALLDADDIWLPHKLSQQLEIFRQAKIGQLGLVYCAYGLISHHSSRLPSSLGVIKPKIRGDVYRALLKGNFISGSGSAVLLRKEVFQEVGLFDENLRAGEDWDMWIRIAQKFTIDYTPEELVLIRLHENNMQKDSLRMLTAELMILNKFYENNQSNLFLLWKIRTILFNRHIHASKISGFDQCTPKLKAQLTGINNLLAGALIFPLAILAKAYLALKH